MVDVAAGWNIWTCKLAAIGHQFKHNLCHASSLYTRASAHICAQTCIKTHTQSPSVTSVTSALGLEKCWVDRWCNNVILWIRVINVGHIGWYLCFYCVKHMNDSISSCVSGITYDIYVTVILNNLKKLNGRNVICLCSWETHSIFIIESFPSPLSTLLPFFLLNSPLFLKGVIEGKWS